MTEDQIERAVERKVDSLDRMFMSTDMTQDAYDKAMKDIHAWAEAQYAKRPRW